MMNTITSVGRTQMDLNDELLLLLHQPDTDDKLYHMRELLKNGADSDAVDFFGNRPIHLAILRSPANSKLVLELLHFGAHLNVVNKHGTTPLTSSMFNRAYESTEILIKRGIDLDFQCRRGWTALMIASMLGDRRSVKILLLHGANIDKYDMYHKTALMYACEGNYLNVIKELLAYGANPGMRDNAHNTALHYYMKRPYPRLDVVNELLLHCASFNDIAVSLEKSFMLIMKKCLRGQPPYDVCVQTIVKNQMLLNHDFSYIRRFGDLFDFAVSCSVENRFMDRTSVGAGTSVKRLAEKCLQAHMPRESELERLLPFVANNDFPIYSDILRALVRKSFLRKKFMSMSVYGRINRPGKKVTLNSDVNLKIMSYLSDDDIASFVLASCLRVRR